MRQYQVALQEILESHGFACGGGTCKTKKKKKGVCLSEMVRTRKFTLRQFSPVKSAKADVFHGGPFDEMMTSSTNVPGVAGMPGVRTDFVPTKRVKQAFEGGVATNPGQKSRGNQLLNMSKKNPLGASVPFGSAAHKANKSAVNIAVLGSNKPLFGGKIK